MKKVLILLLLSSCYNPDSTTQPSNVDAAYLVEIAIQKKAIDSSVSKYIGAIENISDIEGKPVDLNNFISEKVYKFFASAI